jgi:hypothetical protein
METTIVRGEEFHIGWRFRWPDFEVKVLTGFSVAVQIRPFENSNTVIASYTEASQQIVFIPAAGAVDLYLSPSDTSVFDFKTAVIDCWVRNSTDGDRSATTKLILTRGVSR